MIIYEQPDPLSKEKPPSEDSLGEIVVDDNGEIEMPFVGKVYVKDLAIGDIQEKIQGIMNEYLKESVVYVKLGVFNLTILGEVARPGMFTVNNEKVNIFEALAMAGDLTVWGMRDNVKLIREDATGKREIINLNLNNAGVVTCPYYYLQHNDILYVTPNETKAKNSDIGQSTSLWFSATSILVSIASLLVTIFR